VTGLSQRLLSKIETLHKEEDKVLHKAIKIITGKRPYNLSLYQLAMQHASVAQIGQSGQRESNERLEYLGDAVLGLIVAEFLFTKFPFKGEGFLTELRSKMVNREALNNISRKIGITDLIQFQRTNKANIPKSIYGDCLEALIGAFYLDQGYNETKKFIIKKIIGNHFDLDELATNVSNYKSKVIEWAQKENKSIQFDVIEDIIDGQGRQFTAQIVIEGETIETGYGYSKKKAEQDAARRTLEKIDINASLYPES
jgi:ribonuclease III